MIRFTDCNTYCLQLEVMLARGASAAEIDEFADTITGWEEALTDRFEG